MNPHALAFPVISPACIIFAGISLVNLAILLTECVLLLVRKPKLQPRNYVILAGQLAKLCSAMLLLTLPQGTRVFSVSICLCAAVCLLSGILTSGGIPSQKQPFQRLWRLVYLLCCAYVSGFLVLLICAAVP